MITNKKSAETKDRKIILSTLWTFVMFNYVYGDLTMMIFNPSVYQGIAAKMNQGVVLGATALFEIAIAMILAARVLKRGANRWANIIAGTVFTVWVAVTLVGGKAPAYFLFLSAIEIACTAFIVWYAWTWTEAAALS